MQVLPRQQKRDIAHSNLKALYESRLKPQAQRLKPQQRDPML